MDEHFKPHAIINYDSRVELWANFQSIQSQHYNIRFKNVYKIGSPSTVMISDYQLTVASLDASARWRARLFIVLQHFELLLNIKWQKLSLDKLPPKDRIELNFASRWRDGGRPEVVARLLLHLGQYQLFLGLGLDLGLVHGLMPDRRLWKCTFGWIELGLAEADIFRRGI